MPAPRKPDELHVLEGTFRDDRHGDPDLAVVATGEAQAPAHLKGEARAFWNSIVPGLIVAGLAHERDSAELAMMCEWYARYRRFGRLLDKTRNADRRVYQMTLQLAIAQDKFEKIASKFGLTPSDRAKLRSVEKPKKDGVQARKRG